MKRIIELNDAGRRSSPATSSSPTTRSTAASRTSTTSSSRCRSSPADELVAWTANIAHWNDVGGMVPGSMSNEATRDLPGGAAPAGHQADLGGRADPSVIEIMKANSRLPDFLHGDMWAGIAAVRVGERRILELVDEVRHRDVHRPRCAYFMDYGEQVALARARASCRRAASARRGAGQRRRLQGHGRDHRRRVHRRPARQPGPGSRARTTPRRDGDDHRRADGLQEHHRRRTRSRTGALPAAQGADPPGLGLRRRAARRRSASTTRSRSGSTT